MTEDQLLEQANLTFAAAQLAIANGDREAAEVACAAARVAHEAFDETQSFSFSDPLFDLNDEFRAAFGVPVFSDLEDC